MLAHQGTGQIIGLDSNSRKLSIDRVRVAFPNFLVLANLQEQTVASLISFSIDNVSYI